MLTTFVLILQDHYRIGIPNGGLEQTLGILRAVRRHNLETRYTPIPPGVVLGVLRGDTRRKAVGSAESDIAWLNPTGHVVCLRSGVDDLVYGLHGEIEGHELALVGFG